MRHPGASLSELELLFRQLAAAARAHLSFAEVVAILRQEDDRGRYGALLAAMGAKLEKGESLSSALGAAGKVFAPETLAFVRRAEESGALASALDILAGDYSRRAAARRAVVNALYWPTALTAVLVILLLILFIFVVPAFKEVYASFGADLPAPTLALIEISDWFVTWLWLPLLILALGVAWLSVFRERAPSRLVELYDRLRLRAPVIGAFRRKLFQLRAAALLGAAAGQDRQFAAAALAHLGATAENRRLASWVHPLAQRVADGGDLLGAVRQTPEVPRRIAAILELGVKTGDIGAARLQIEAWCEAELETGLPRFQTNVLALSYLVLGIVLGFVVIALYLPIFKLGAAV